MSMTFYYSPMSTASVTALVLEELELPCERVKLDLRAGDTRKPEFLQLNPNGKVPVFVHDGTALWESTAITMYLGETFGVQKNLYPAPGPKRGEAMKWIAWSGVTLVDAVYQWTRNTMSWTPADHHNEKAGEAGRLAMLDCLRIVNEALKGKNFFLGSDYSLVDTHVCSLMDWLGHMKVDFSPYPELQAWLKRCQARPAYQRQLKNDN